MHRNHAGRACDHPAITASGLCGECAFILWSEKQAETVRKAAEKGDLWLSPENE
jgi:hypothetical protein